jgi:LysR family transcriptional activator of nhaA
MSWLNYHHLLYFWTVARLGSVTAASEELRLARPTISAQIRMLEQTLGHKLFVQAGRKLVLTEAGQVAYRYANDIFTLGKEMIEDLEGRSAAGILRVRIGVTDVLPKPIAYRFLAPALRIPNLRLVCHEGKPNSLMEQLIVNELDLVLSDFPVAPQFKADTVTRLLGRSKIQVFGTPKLASDYAPGFPRSLDGAPFLLPTENTSMRRLLNQWFASRNVRPDIVAEYEDSELLKEHGQRGGGIFAASGLMGEHTRRSYRVTVLGTLDTVRIRYYAVSLERQMKHPAVAAIIEGARKEPMA